MSLLQVADLAYTHAAASMPLFERVGFDVQPGDRIALVGPNGVGKTTLLRLLTGELKPGAGVVAVKPGIRLGYVPQVPSAPRERMLAEHVIGADPAIAPHRAALAALAEQLEDEACALAYAEALDAYGAAGGYALEAEVERVLDGLGFSAAERTLPLGALSSGQRARAELARLLVSPCDVLLIDEPTNHLDLTARAWLEDYLAGLEAAVLLVSHDRVFLDRTARRTFELRGGTLTVYEGDFDFYREGRAQRERQAWEAYEAQQRRFEANRRAADKRLALARRVAVKPRNQDIRPGADFYRAKAARVEKTARMLKERTSRERPAEKPRLDEPIPTLTFPGFARSGERVLTAEGLCIQAGERTLFDGLELAVMRGTRLAIVGPNGAGKTTLLRTLIGLVAPAAGTVQLGAGVRLGYYAQETEHLPAERSPLALCLEVHPDLTWVRTVLACLRLRGEKAEKPLGAMSAGERGKVALARLILGGANLLVLDEPTNHLDIEAREALEATLEQFPGTIVFVSHDRHFVERLADEVLSVGEDADGE